MKQLKLSLLSTFLLCLTAPLFAQEKSMHYDDELLVKIRTAAKSDPGQRAIGISYIKFAESPRTFAQTVQNGDNIPYIQARTAYQIVFNDSTFMIDAGMDKTVHEFFGKGKKEPYFKDKNDSIQMALLQAKKILITHEHGDHVAGVIRSPNQKKLAPKTTLTTEMVNTLINNPQMPELKLDATKAKAFNVVDFKDILAVAPGIVLIKAPGHTPGEIMIYVQLQDAREYLFTGDVSWSYRGIEEKKLKPLNQIQRIKENAVQIQYEIDWLNTLQAKGIQLIVSHDDIIQPELIKKGILHSGLKKE